MPRTNNNVEGWHNRINSLMSCHHPKIFKFLDGLKKEQDEQELRIIQINAGESTKKKHVKYERNDARLKKLIDNYAEETENGFLHYMYSVANNIYV